MKTPTIIAGILLIFMLQNVKDMTNVIEIWKQVSDYLDYEISNLGNVRKGKLILKQQARSKSTPYRVICLWKNKSRKSFLIHRLVAQAFVHNPHNKPFVNHIDGDKLNNIFSNLEWCTHAENMQHAFDTGLNKQSHKSCNTGESSGNAKITSKDVLFIRESELTQQELANIFCISQTQVFRIKHKLRWQHIS